MPRLFVFDAMGLAYRAYYAFIRRPLVNSRGENTSAVFGFTNTVLKIRREEHPDYWALAWDGPGPTHRHDRYADYKATRKPMPEDLFAQLPAIEDVAAALGLPVLEVPGVEADDVMATLAHRGEADGFDVTLVTSDKDMAQLVNERVKLLSPVARGEDYVWVDAAAVREKWSVEPAQTRDVLALMGDSTDNIPGVPGIGPKTATELIREFGSLEALYENLGQVERTSLRLKLAANRELAFLSQELVTVKIDCDLPYTWDQLVRGPVRRDALLALSKRYEIHRLERIATTEGVDESAAGAAVPARSAERRGTAAETPSPGVKLMGPSWKPGGGSDSAADSRAAKTVIATPFDAAPAPRVTHQPSTSVSPAVASSVAPSPVASPPRAPSPAVASPVAASPVASPSPAPSPVVWSSVSAPSSSRASASQGALDLWTLGTEAQAASGLDVWRERLHEVRARALHGLALLPLGSSSDPRRSRLVGVALAARNGSSCYVPLGHDSGPNFTLDEVRGWLAPMLADPAVPKVGEDLKRDAHLFAGAGMPLEGLAFDTHIGSFLCDPARGHGLAAMARDFLGIELPGFDEVAEGRSGRARVGPAALEPAAVAAALEPAAAALFPLADALRAQIESRDQWTLYASLEHPLIPVLLEMEDTGIKLDVAVLRELGDQAARDITALEEELYAMAGERINLNSGPQLAKVLFEDLKLAPGRRTKTGYSTDLAVLEELAAKHSFPARLIEYRTLSKLKSTYYDALPLAVDARDGRVHTSYNPIGASTGRLSSSNPNLQNIPIRTTQGRAIRRAFVAAQGMVLVGADYSQIELRLMAHLSGDTNLIDAFKSGEDIHASTARKIFGITGELDPALRSRAKIVNFGIMYGMGARSLSSQMKIPLADAQDFIKNYFRVFSGVREYMDRQLDDARRSGYVQTLMGRRLYLPQLSSTHGGDRSSAERIAINAPIQGSAADLMKLAMIRVHHSLKPIAPSARLLLQVHDELLIESPAEAADAVAERVRVEMEGCFALRVPLVVSLGSGPTWFDVH